MAQYDEYNPIRSVDGKAVYCPASFTYDLIDVSDSDAGRTEDTEMQKMRIGQAVKLHLGWQNIETKVVSEVLRAFNPQYITVCYLDGLDGAYRTAEFYVGDRSAPMYNAKLGLWSNVSFDIIERKAKNRDVAQHINRNP